MMVDSAVQSMCLFGSSYGTVRLVRSLIAGDVGAWIALGISVLVVVVIVVIRRFGR